MRTTRTTLAGLATAAALFGGAAVGTTVLADGVASAQTTTTDSSSSSSSSTADARPDPGTRMREVLAGLVDDGVIDQEQADAVATALEAARPARPGGHGFPLEVAADAIGVDREILAAALRDGSTIADVAAEHGVEAQTVIDALVADAQDHLDQAVADGHLTEDEATQRLDDLTQHATDVVNGDAELRGPGPMGPGHGAPPEDRAEAPAASTAS